MILVFWSMNLSYSPHQSYPSGNQDWASLNIKAVQAAPLSKTPFLEMAGLKKRVGYAWYFGYFEWVRWTVMVPLMEENPALPLIWIFINWWLGARFLLSTVLRPSCSLGLVMGIHFSYAGGGTREVASALRAGCCTRRGEIGGSCILSMGISPRSPSVSGEVGGWWNMNQIFYKGGRSSSSKNPWVNKHTQMRKVSRCLPIGFFRRKFHQTHGWNATCDASVSPMPCSFLRDPGGIPPCLWKCIEFGLFCRRFGAAAFSSGAKIEDFFHQRSTFLNSFLIFGMGFVWTGDPQISFGLGFLVTTTTPHQNEELKLDIEKHPIWIYFWWPIKVLREIPY